MSKELRIWPLPNALKHGAFSETVVLPTEDPGQFEKLRQSLIRELQPSGSLEEDAVFTIAKLMWRKQRLSIFRKTEILRKTLTPHLQKSPIVQLKEGMEAHREMLAHTQERLEADKIFDQFLLEQSDALKDYKGAVGPTLDDETRSSLISAIREAQSLKELAAIAEFITPEQYIKDLEIEARIDSQLDRQLKRLFFLKGMKDVASLNKISGKAS